ncbi:MAG: hypothetical protein QME05_06905 [Candidatus Margulisbacteria bacterium]|nr:hypothetical protein [Candidatus Margulisiibacteriota bacterium]
MAIFINSTIYLYYTDMSQSPGVIALRTSSDNGATFTNPQNTIGLPESACDPDPTVLVCPSFASSLNSRIYVLPASKPLERIKSPTPRILPRKI